MTPQHGTNLAAAICKPHGISVAYEWNNTRGFVWNFYRNGKLLSQIKSLRRLIDSTEKLVDNGK